MRIVIFHGAFGSPDSNWIPELRNKLEALGQEVVVPRFPVDSWDDITKLGKGTVSKNQTLKNWLDVFDPIAQELKKEKELCFVGHSLGPLFILHCIEKYNLKLDCGIFVGPFLRRLGRSWQIDVVNSTFYKTSFDFRKLKKSMPVSYVLYSENDPYVDKIHSLGFSQRLNSSLLSVKKAGHMNSEVNLNEFPLVFELCKTRLDLTLYQRYMAHRKEIYSVDYIDPKSEEVVYLDPNEVFDEGVFKFRNLRKSGFCTFFTALDFWDTQSIYHEQARAATKRIKDFTRVFVVDGIQDLTRPLIKKQIELDFKAGVKIYLVMASSIENEIKELDFGIWDEEYLCVVRFNKDKQVGVRLSSRRKDIKEAENWQKFILSKSVLVKDRVKDVTAFVNENKLK